MYLQSYKQLIVWQKAMDLVQIIYAITSKLPKEEVYGLSTQMKRSAVSIPSNIAEGYKRKGIGEFLQFLSISDASAAELETQILIGKRLYSNIDFSKAILLLDEVQKMLVGMIKKLNAKRYTLNANSGFTLTETLVTAAVFSVVITIISSAFVSALDMQRRAFNIQQVEENTNFLLEAMAKEIRVSTINDPDSNCPTSPATILNITHPVNGSIRYTLSGTKVERRVNGVDTIISSGSVQFTRLQFCVSGNTATDQRQPRVTLIAGMKSTETKQQATIDFQTTLSARFLQEP